MRISELCGLTKSDIDFERRRIRASKQLTRTRHTGSCEYNIEKPKTESGEQYIPMLDDAVYQGFRRIIQKRREPKVEYIIDGYTGFLFWDKDDKPRIKFAPQLTPQVTPFVRKFAGIYVDFRRVRKAG